MGLGDESGAGGAHDLEPVVANQTVKPIIRIIRSFGGWALGTQCGFSQSRIHFQVQQGNGMPVALGDRGHYTEPPEMGATRCPNSTRPLWSQHDFRIGFRFSKVFAAGP
jgi:hypothetical protein